MVWLFFAACILFVFSEVWFRVVARKRIDAVRAYVQDKHPDVYSAQLAGAGNTDPKLINFLQSPDNLGDATLAGLKRDAHKAATFGLKPLIFTLGVMVVIYILSAVLALVR